MKKINRISRRQFVKVAGAGAISLALLGCNKSFFSHQTPESFTIIVLPDTQVYSEAFPDIFKSQTRWIVDNKDRLNIVFVAHEGDITNCNCPEQWTRAKESMSLLDGVTPYSMCLGNHDIGTGGNADNRTTMINNYFPLADFESKAWFGGHMGNLYNNHYCYFQAGETKFMCVTLEFGPRDKTLEWAGEIIKNHPDRQVIILTHCYMNYDNTRVGTEDPHNPHLYPVNKISLANDGEQMWNKLVKKHENIFLVLSGHIVLKPGMLGYPEDGAGKPIAAAGRLISLGNHGNTVHQVLANYQDLENGGNGWLRTMKFIPAENKIEVKTYSPYLDTYMQDSDNQFKLHYNMVNR